MTGKFYFDGVPSDTLGVYIVNINTSDDTMPALGGQSITAQNVIEHDYSTFIRATKENLRFNMFFTLLPSCDENGNEIRGAESFAPERLNSLSKYFARSVPVEFMIEEDKAKVIKIIPTGGIEIVRFGEMKGYFQIIFQATTPYWMTPMEVLSFKLYADNSFSVVNGRNIQDRHGNYDIHPKLVIKNIFAQNPSLILHNTTTGKRVIFNNVMENDTITMHHRIINSELTPDIFHKWNKQPFYLTENQNNITVNNDCIIDIHMQYPIF